MVKLNLGCGIWFRKGFINVDYYIDEEEVLSKKGGAAAAIVEKGYKFVKADIKDMPFPDDYADYVELMNTIEHFPMHHVVEYLKEIHRVMKRGAKLIILTNDMTGLAIDWLQMVSNSDFNPKNYIDVAETIYGNQYGDSLGELHRVPFTPVYLNYCLFNAGFTKGVIGLIPKGAPIPKVGTLKEAKGMVARNNLLVAEMEK
ncbi:methyltransferase domain-containing protein [Candidatus Dojkabacteria bacterium]|jgi:SAM-dependent methyltransferase|nr:methyltransferase domain-containing protein [Candidatus Dojkabacteria bacterium]